MRNASERSRPVSGAIIEIGCTGPDNGAMGDVLNPSRNQDSPRSTEKYMNLVGLWESPEGDKRAGLAR